MKELIITVGVNDDFELGQCCDCPFAYEDRDEYNDWVHYCSLGYRYDECEAQLGAHYKIGEIYNEQKL